jgi:hypothetical protein
MYALFYESLIRKIRHFFDTNKSVIGFKYNPYSNLGIVHIHIGMV